MGGHGGLNILPQKRWNVYRFDNIEKVRKDEEAAAKEEQLKREQARKRDAEFRLEKLRTARGLEPIIQPKETEATKSESKSESKSELNPFRNLETEVDSEKPQSNHINLFEGIKFFDMVGEMKGEKRKFGKDENDDKKRKKTRKEEPPKVVTAEDEKYRLAYGLAGKGVKLPWYMLKSSDGGNDMDEEDDDRSKLRKEKGKSNGKKTVEELREERLKREEREKERVRALISEKNGKGRPVVWDNRYTKR